MEEVTGSSPVGSTTDKNRMCAHPVFASLRAIFLAEIAVSTSGGYTMTSMHRGVMPYTPPQELSHEARTLLQLWRSALYEFILSSEGCEAARDETKFRKILRLTLCECQIDLVYLADAIGVRYATARKWDVKGPSMESSRTQFVLDMARVLWLEIDAEARGRISPQWIFRAENDNDIPLVRSN